MHPDSWRSGKERWHFYPRLFIFPYHNPYNIPRIGWHEPEEAVSPADLSEWSEEEQRCAGREATLMGDQKPG